MVNHKMSAQAQSSHHFPGPRNEACFLSVREELRDFKTLGVRSNDHKDHWVVFMGKTLGLAIPSRRSVSGSPAPNTPPSFPWSLRTSKGLRLLVCSLGRSRPFSPPPGERGVPGPSERIRRTPALTRREDGCTCLPAGTRRQPQGAFGVSEMPRRMKTAFPLVVCSRLLEEPTLWCGMPVGAPRFTFLPHMGEGRKEAGGRPVNFVRVEITASRHVQSCTGFRLFPGPAWRWRSSVMNGVGHHDAYGAVRPTPRARQTPPDSQRPL